MGAVPFYYIALFFVGRIPTCGVHQYGVLSCALWHTRHVCHVPCSYEFAHYAHEWIVCVSGKEMLQPVDIFRLFGMARRPGEAL